MRRLIYAPKAYVFIRSSNMDGRIYDLSTDVVAGSVTRNVNDLSTAEITLRNRFKKWLRDPDTKKQIFLPMDLITIWLQRIAGHPIQVFTGYLDSVPYYQAYPGDCKITASCTLKRLAYTWFDPGLDFFTQWIQHMDGWTYNPATGEAMNPKYRSGTQITDVNFNNVGATATMHDGGFAKLLNDFMVLIGGWEQSDVIVSDLPAHLPQVASRLYTDINNQTNVALDALQEMMAQIMGMGLTSELAATSNSVVPPTAVPVISQIKANATNIPTTMLLFAALALSNFQTNYSQTQVQSSANWGYGLYAMRPVTVASNPPIPNLAPNIVPDFQVSSKIEGFDLSAMSDPGTATQAFVKALNRNGWDASPNKRATWVQLALKGDPNGMIAWIEKALGRKLPAKLNVTVLLTMAKQYDGVSFNTDASANVPVSVADPSKASFTDPRLTLSASEFTALSKRYAKTQIAAPWLAWALEQAHQVSSDLQIVTPPFSSAAVEAIYISGPAPKLQALYNRLKGVDIDRVRMNAQGSSVALVRGNTSADRTNNLPANTMEVFWPTRPTTAASPGTTKNTGSNPASGQQPIKLTMENLAAFSANSAFAQKFSLPTNYAESHLLTGDKALLNDVSCLDAAKQFAQASMRNFMSLPDGRFLAFYPDYFGTVRGPYWYIYDIETVNFGIQLNDEALATHVYVVGDTFAGDGVIDWQDNLTTRGVATITQAMMLESFIEDFKVENGNIKTQALGRLKDAYEFLGHYGARPHKEEFPIIRNTFFEFLLAWQRFMQLWAAQFATEVTFTFQPEVMAGGILGFPDHGVQMYCESVTHSWDYESGFDTTAVLSSPALLHGAKAPDGWAKPGFALGGNVNTVGAAG